MNLFGVRKINPGNVKKTAIIQCHSNTFIIPKKNPIDKGRGNFKKMQNIVVKIATKVPNRYWIPKKPKIKWNIINKNNIIIIKMPIFRICVGFINIDIILH